MSISQRLRTCARHTGLDAVIELLNEAADEIERLSASAALPTLRPGDSHMESLIEAAIQGHASTRDAMRWLVRQVMKPAQQPATTEPVAWSERDQLRHAQAAVVMPMIGPLLDAWENSDREVMSQEPELSKQLKNINSAMEDADTHPAPSAPDDVAMNAERWRHAIADGENQSMNFLDIFDDWDGDGDFVEAFDAAMLAANEGSK